MTVHIELWQLLTFLVGLLITFLGAVFGGGKLLLGQVEKRLDERFALQEKSRVEAQQHWDKKFADIERSGKEEARQWQRIEHDLLRLQADLPLQYVRREDYIRNQTVIEAKLDALALKIENWQLKGVQP